MSWLPNHEFMVLPGGEPKTENEKDFDVPVRRESPIVFSERNNEKNFSVVSYPPSYNKLLILLNKKEFCVQYVDQILHLPVVQNNNIQNCRECCGSVSNELTGFGLLLIKPSHSDRQTKYLPALLRSRLEALFQDSHFWW